LTTRFDKWPSGTFGKHQPQNDEMQLTSQS